MQNKYRVIADADDIFFYFEMLKTITPGSILDVGMFLKRIGAVSRQAMSYEIPETVKLWGIDLIQETELKIYHKVYDKIIPGTEFFETDYKNAADDKFDVAVILKTQGWMNDEQQKTLWEYMLRGAAAVMTDEEAAKNQVTLGRIKGYYPIHTGSKAYAWIPTGELRGEI